MSKRQRRKAKDVTDGSENPFAEHAGKRFEALGRNALWWRERATGLRETANMVWDHIGEVRWETREETEPRWLRFGPVAMMLGAFALEALAKGVRVYQKPSLVSGGRWALGLHDLEKLIPDTGLQITAREKSVLVQLTGYLKWAGRYAIPLDVKHLTPRPVGHNRVEAPAGTVMSTDYRRIVDDIFARLEALPVPLGEHEEKRKT